LIGSSLFDEAEEALDTLSDIYVARLALLEIKSGETPNRVFDENLIYNAAGALYDFISFDLLDRKFSEYELGYQTRAFETLVKTDLLGKLEEFVRAHFPFRVDAGLLREELQSEIAAAYSEFNANVLGNKEELIESVQVHFPIVCVNGSIYLTKLNEEIDGFEEIPYCITSIRKAGWPGDLEGNLVRRKPEVPVIVTNPQNLEEVLHRVQNCVENYATSIEALPAASIDKWILETSLYRKAVEWNNRAQKTKKRGYRSDLSY